MPDNRALKIAAALEKYGTKVTLNFKPVANDEVNDDWPDPLAPTTPPPDPIEVDAVCVPQADLEHTNVSNAGRAPVERVQAFFKSDQDLNEVDSVTWQGNDYQLAQQKAYELSGDILVQEVLLVRTRAAVIAPHA